MSVPASSHMIRLGLCNTYLIEGAQGSVLVDAGCGFRPKTFLERLRERKISPDTIKLVVVTHVHFDHVGGLRMIRDLCGCAVAVHEQESSRLRNGVMVFPPGTNRVGRVASLLGRKLAARMVAFDPVEPDILMSDAMPLEAYGLRGEVIPTPGHTVGSVSVLLSSGVAFVGDLATNFFPSRRGPIMPPFAQDKEALLHSWDTLLTLGAETICPGHGYPFAARLLRRKMGLLKGKAHSRINHMAEGPEKHA